jgi:hypothetical protein
VFDARARPLDPFVGGGAQTLLGVTWHRNLVVARLSGRPVLPVGLFARPNLRCGSWDRMLLPLPFARAVCHYGQAVVVERNADPERRKAARQELEAKLEQLTQALEINIIGGWRLRSET